MDGNSPLASERRSSERRASVRPAKVYDPRADRFYAGRTSNISADGALLCLRRSLPVHVGDRFEVGIAGDGDEVLLRLADLRLARVVRVTALDALEQAIAIEFNEPSAIPMVPEVVPSIQTRANHSRAAA